MATLGTSEHSRKRHLWTIQVVLINRIILTSRMTKPAKQCQILYWRQSNYLKHLTSFPLPDVVQCPCLYRHPLEIQPDYVISRLRGNPCKIEFCVKLGMMPTQTNACMNYKVSRKLIFKRHERFREGRESPKDDSRSDRPVNVRWHNLSESLMDPV